MGNVPKDNCANGATIDGMVVYQNLWRYRK